MCPQEEVTNSSNIVNIVTPSYRKIRAWWSVHIDIFSGKIMVGKLGIFHR